MKRLPATCALIAAMTATQQNSPPSLKSTTVPDALDGSYSSTKPGELYDFAYYSDVETTDVMYEYVYQITNRSNDRFLPARWTRARLRFAQIAPNSSVTLQFKAYEKFASDTSSVIEYGPTSQFKFPAPAYVVSAETTTLEVAADRSTMSSIVGKFMPSESEVPVNLEVTTAQSGDKLVYSFVNRGKVEVRLEIGELTKLLQNIKAARIEVDGKWPESKPGNAEESAWFVARPDKRPHTFVLSISKETGIYSKICPLIVRDTHGEVLTESRLGALLPVVGK